MSWTSRRFERPRYANASRFCPDGILDIIDRLNLTFSTASRVSALSNQPSSHFEETYPTPQLSARVPKETR